jgi:hypothetical protein
VIEFRGACARHRAALLDFVDHGEIAPGTAPALAHLERCARCTDELESTILAITALRRYGDALALAEPSPDAWPRLRARLETLRPRRWAIMSPSAGMVMSIALVAVLVAPLRFGASAPSPNPTHETAVQLGASLEERRAEASYLARVRVSPLVVTGPTRPSPTELPRRYPDNVHRDWKEVAPVPASGRPLAAI